VKPAVSPPTLEIAFDATGASEAGRRGRVVVVIDVEDSSTTAEALVASEAAAVFGASPAGSDVPVGLDPGAVGRRAAAAAGRVGTDVVVVAGPEGQEEEERRDRALPVLQALRTASVPYDLVPDYGLDLPGRVDILNRVVVIVSPAGGTAYDAALAAGAAAACFATTAPLEGRVEWDVIDKGIRRAVALAEQHGADLSILAATAGSSDDGRAAFELAQAVMASGFLKL
jgi:hypothetical protein